MDHCQRIRAIYLYTPRCQSRPDFRWRLRIARRKHLQTKLRDAHIYRLFGILEDGPDGVDDRLKLRYSVVENLAFLEPVRQLLLCRGQPLPLRVLEYEHDIVETITLVISRQVTG